MEKTVKTRRVVKPILSSEERYDKFCDLLREIKPMFIYRDRLKSDDSLSIKVEGISDDEKRRLLSSNLADRISGTHPWERFIFKVGRKKKVLKINNRQANKVKDHIYQWALNEGVPKQKVRELFTVLNNFGPNREFRSVMLQLLNAMWRDKE